MTLVRWAPKAAVRYAPGHEMPNWMNEWDHMVGELLGRAPASCCDWVPALDVREKENDYLVKVDLPGLKKEDLKITFENDVLTITGERKAEQEEPDGKVHRSERFVGKFTRSLRFPSDVDPAQIDASFKEGVLEVKLLKSEAAMVRQIEVK